MMITILIPHFKNGKITAYTISQILKHKGDNGIKIIIIDNNDGDESIKYLKPFKEHVTIVPYPKDLLQSHGLAFEYVLELGYVSTEYFITLESDGFPVDDAFISYYFNLIKEGYEVAGSIMQLSGGTFLHACGAMYKRSVWEEARRYCDAVQYYYFPNMGMKEGFQCHMMVHHSIINEFLENPEDYIELSDSYKPYTKSKALDKLNRYKGVVAPFHNGMGRLQESIKTYGCRTPETEAPNVLLDNRAKIIYRIGYEPSEWFHFWCIATGKKIFNIPSETKWLPNKIGQQQEYTYTSAGVKHIWAGSSFLDMKNTIMNDVYEFKYNQIETLYNALPEEQKI